jgi:hypothetical protein
LRNDFERGNLLLRVNGQEAIEEESQFKGEDLSFVQEMFDVTETIYESEEASELKEVEQKLRTLYEELTNIVKQQFSSRDFKAVLPNLAKLNIVNKKLAILETKLKEMQESKNV